MDVLRIGFVTIRFPLLLLIMSIPIILLMIFIIIIIIIIIIKIIIIIIVWCMCGALVVLTPCRDFGQVLRSQLPVALRREILPQYPCYVKSASE